MIPTQVELSWEVEAKIKRDRNLECAAGPCWIIQGLPYPLLAKNYSLSPGFY
jgi:hypothetical protein